MKEIIIYLDSGNVTGYEGLPSGYELVIRESDVDDDMIDDGRGIVTVDGTRYEETRP